MLYPSSQFLSNLDLNYQLKGLPTYDWVMRGQWCCANCSPFERSLGGQRSSLQTLALVQFASACLRVEEVRYRISHLIECSLIGEWGCVVVLVCICVGVRYGKRETGARKEATRMRSCWKERVRELERVMCTPRKHLLKGKAHKQACQE